MLNQFGVFYVPQAFARDDNNIPANQSVLVEAKRFAHQTLEAIALNGELYALLADHQPETGVIQIVVTRKEQEIFPRNLAGRGVKGLSNCQTRTTFGAATRQDSTAVLGSHASTEAVGTGAFDGAWLESTFHGVVTWFVHNGPEWPPF